MSARPEVAYGGSSRQPSSEAMRALVAKAVAHKMDAAGLQYALADHNRELAHLVRRQDEVAAAIEAAKTRLADATGILDEHDHPLHRRGHRPEIAHAKVEVRDLPGRIGQLEDEGHELTVATERERAARDRTARLGSGPARADADRVSRALDSDARVRGERAADHPSGLLVANLGPVPADPVARDRWVTAAGRIAQHHALWPIPPDQIIGSRPRAMGQDDYAFTHHAVQRAVADLHRSLGVRRPPPARSAPGLSL